MPSVKGTDYSYEQRPPPEDFRLLSQECQGNGSAPERWETLAMQVQVVRKPNARWLMTLTVSFMPWRAPLVTRRRVQARGPHRARPKRAPRRTGRAGRVRPHGGGYLRKLRSTIWSTGIALGMYPLATNHWTWSARLATLTWPPGSR